MPPAGRRAVVARETAKAKPARARPLQGYGPSSLAPQHGQGLLGTGDVPRQVGIHYGRTWLVKCPTRAYYGGSLTWPACWFLCEVDFPPFLEFSRSQSKT